MKEGCDVNFLLDNKLMIVQKNFEDFQDLGDVEDFEVIAPIRRLSTESYTTNPENPVATVWTWYWKDQDGIWLQYDVDQLVRFKTGFISGIACWVSKIYVVGVSCVVFRS
ncbi:Zinc finger CCCH-type antiviral [Desmophyllum pertusum]|uniref:Zinc finger CCCH-type antiviral n=1 Tax=Desmophyllum pertusum TaxID=174260 RepID=A0A9W9YEX9_9CNID|nr:Zinc finger CCCH-type antiviral [Desmophyllum pertusum]